jgi:hypothetical protein
VFSRFEDQSIIADSIVSRMSSTTTQQTLVNQGADKRFTVSPVTLYDSPEPMVEVTGTGSSPAESLKTGNLVSTALEHSLYTLQRAQGTDPAYMFSALQVASSPPQIKVSGKLRSILGVLGVGAIFVFIVASVGDAIDKKRAEAGSTLAVNGKGPQRLPRAQPELPLWTPSSPVRSVGL